MLRRLALRETPVALLVVRPADAEDDRHRAPGGGNGAGARRQARAPHRVRRHRRGDPGDQRDPPRPVPPEAVGPARGAALPGPRRSPRRLARHVSGRRSRGSGWSATAGRPGPTRSRTTSPATSSRTAGSTSRRTRRRRGSPARRRSTRAAIRCSSSPTGRTCWPPRTPRSPRRSGCGPVPACAPTTSSSSAAGRRASRRPSTAPRRACARCSSSARRPAARPGRRRASRTTWASRRASPAPTSHVAPSPRRPGSAPSS